MENARSIQVLLVDDSPLVRQHLQQILTDHQKIHIVGQASNHQDALESVKILQPNIVLININMPGMDAVATSREIRLRYPTVVVIGLSITAQADEHLERAKRQKETAKKFRALGEPLLHARWRNRGADDSTLPPHERAC